MANRKGYAAASQYGQVATTSEVNDASPHRLVQMLLEGALEKIATAKGHITRGEVCKRNANVTWAIGIINGLRMSLDKEAGGDIAQNLDDLYDYMCRRLLDATRDSDADALDEVTSLLLEIKSAWDALPAILNASAAASTQQAVNNISEQV